MLPTGLFCWRYFLFLNVAPLIRQQVDRSQHDCCVNTVDEKNRTAKNLTNFGPVTPKILWLICIGSDCREANIRTV